MTEYIACHTVVKDFVVFLLMLVNDHSAARCDERFQWEMLFFGVWQLRNLLTDFQKILHSWLRRRPHPTCKSWGQSVQRGRVCACVKLSPSGVYFFSPFFKVPCASLQVGPWDRSTPLTAQTTRPVGIHIPYMVWIIKINIFPIFFPKIWKIALRPMATSKGYNSGTFEDTCTLFAPKWGFSGSGNRMVSFKFTPDRPLLLWQPTTVIWTQNWQ